MSIPIWQSAEQKTWLKRFKQFLLDNNLTIQFSEDLKDFFDYLKTDFINEHGEFGVKLVNYLNLDEDFQLAIQRINYTTKVLIETLFQIGFFGENLLQDYLNK
jgi:tagatose-1,6-bisphosphate aldolase